MDPALPASPVEPVPAQTPVIPPPTAPASITPPVAPEIPASPVTQTETLVVAKSSGQPTISAPSPSKSGSLKTIGIILSVLLFVLLGSFFAAYLVATEKVPAPNPEIKQAVSSFVFSVPFIPKTPGFIVNSFIGNSGSVTRGSFDFSLAATSSDLQSLIGGSNFDLHASGYTDFTNQEKPLTDLKIEVGNLINVQLKQTPEKLYFKINQIPAFIYLLLGAGPEQIEPLLQNWVYTDTATLQTTARDTLNQIPGQNSPVNEAAQTAFKQIFTEDVLPHLRLSNENLNGTPVYKLNYLPTPEQLDNLSLRIFEASQKLSGDTNPVPATVSGTKLSQTLSNVDISAWIDSGNHLHKISFTAVYDPSYLKDLYQGMGAVGPDFSAPVNFAAVLNLSDFNRSLPVTAPENSISAEEFYSRFNQIIQTAAAATPSAILQN